MRRRLSLLALVAVPLIAFTGCASGADEATSGGPATEFVKQDPLVIGYSVYDLQNPYWQAWSAGVKAAAEENGATVVVADQKSSQQEQVSGSLDLINQGISALIVTPVQPSALPATIDAAHDAQIPVVIGDIGTAGDYDAYVLSNNYNGGEQAAQYLVDLAGTSTESKKVGVIELHAGSVVGEERVDGFKDALAKDTRFEIVASLSGEDTVDGGYAAAQDMLSANPDLDIIYAANDASAVGAQRALETAGKSVADGFTLIGFDGNDDALGLIEDGLMSATIAQDPYGQGEAAVKTALALLDGKDPEFSDADTKTVFFPVTVVTKDTVAEFTAGRENR
ncbi:MAG TPA: substrate-binding domain-containing protein [Mycetocola sp.]|jgi:ribose transport system substrate-binding protein|uniref:substrate-binding domain-containing protein n=1 Tax=Mycetocola sp. TaxID=1871042 RepID=UPI00260AEC73|nr:substrate-binding domain-containing protein [Mycetocola sp.]MCU1419069.1 periplasmic binding protein/LacI transcriptional regulator [Mycetocola sp.]MCU1561193.1 periplasmic binding protein/LacI transcriptional regulator [Mycetocola sp.]HEV7847993.1 substrate-binding domain-containing protein [Mycetocola sp.]